MDVFFQMRFAYAGKPDGIIPRRKAGGKAPGDAELLRQFDLLERITLPCLRDQSDPAFKLTLLCSARMPRDGKDHLDWLLNQYLPGRSRAIHARPMVAGRVFRADMHARSGGDDPVVQTQICDGDGFGHGFVKRLREHAIELWARLTHDQPPLAVDGTFLSFHRGLYLGLDGNAFTGLEQISAPSMPFGLSLVARASSRYNPHLINPGGLGVKFPHVQIMTRKMHCLRAVQVGDAGAMLPPEQRILTQAEADFGILRTGHRITSVDNQKIADPVDVSRMPRLRRTG